MRTGRAARYAWGVLAFNLAVVAWGAFVRASASGAGCGSHWPLCNGVIVPRAPRIETIIEFAHRTSSGLAAIAVFALALWVARATTAGHPARRPAATAAALMVVEALLGAGLVLVHWVANNASVGRVVSLGLHLINTFLLLAALALTAWRLSGAPGNAWRRQGTDAALALAVLAMTVAVGLTGAITSLGDTLYPSTSLSAGLREDFSGTTHFLVRLRVIHPALALATGLAALLMAAALARRRASPATARLSVLVRSLVVVQIIGGFVNLALLAPIWMQLVHLVIADLVWLSLVLLTAAALAVPSAPSLAQRPE